MRVLLGCHLLLDGTESDGESLTKGINFSKPGMKINGTVIYKDWATWDSGRKQLAIIRQSDCICRDVNRSEFSVQKDGTYDEGS